MFPPSSGKLSVFRTNPLGRAGTAAEPGRGQGEKRGPPGAAPAAHLVEEGAVRHGDAQPAGAHAQHHVVRGVVAVAPALAAEQPPDGFSAEDHPAGGRAGALEPLEPLLLGWLTPPPPAGGALHCDPAPSVQALGTRPELSAQGSDSPRRRWPSSRTCCSRRVRVRDAAGDWTELSSRPP